MQAFITARGVLRQDLDDIEKIEDSVDALSVTTSDAAIAAIVFVGSCLLAWIAGKVVRRMLRRLANTPEYVDQLASRFVGSLFVFVGFAIALERLGVDIGWFAVILALIGVVILLMIRPLVENGASALLLTTRPAFAVGDTIETSGHTGEVIAINARSTVLKTRDHRRVHIPNNDVLDNPIIVYTAYGSRRSDFELEVAYGSDLTEVSRLLVGSISEVEGVLPEPAPRVRIRGFGIGTVVLRVQWWHDASPAADAMTLSGVVGEVKRALDAAGVDMPSPELIVRRAIGATDEE